MTFHTSPPARSSPVWDLQIEGRSDGTHAESYTHSPVQTHEAFDGWRVWSPAQEWEIKWPLVRQYYSVSGSSDTSAFVLQRHYLLDLLLDAYPRLKSLFGPAAILRLSCAADPDIGGRRYLRVYIMAALPVTEVLRRMDRFTEEWWLDRIARAGRHLVFVADFA